MLTRLKNIPANLIHEPHKLSTIEQTMYGCKIGEQYPSPIVDVEETRKIASALFWSFRKKEEVKVEGGRILARHVNNPKSYLMKKKKPKQDNQTSLL